MIDTPDTLALAQRLLLTNLVRLLFKERAIAKGQTGKDILEWSERLKRDCEEDAKTNTPADAARINAFTSAAIDEFFDRLVSDLNRPEGS